MARRDWLLRAKTVGSLVLLLVPVLALLAVVWFVALWGALFVLGIPGMVALGALDAFVPGFVADTDALFEDIYWPCIVLSLCATGCVVVWMYHGRKRSAEALLDEFVTAPATPDAQPVLCEAVSSVAQHLDCPEPDVVVAGPDAPAALSIGVKPADSTLLVSSRTLAELDPAEVEAVVAHELAHLKNRDSALKTLLLSPTAVTMAHGIVYFPLLPGLVLYWLLVQISGGTYARVREQVADRTAARVTGDPAAFATALETLDDHAAVRPSEDARRQAVAALSIVPDPAEFHYGAERDIKPVVWPVQKPIRKAWMRLTAKHPRTERRVDALRRVERGQERV